MNWLVQKLAGAVLAGIGFKLGSDLYDAVKSRLKQEAPAEKASPAQEGVAAMDAETSEEGEGDQEQRRNGEGRAAL